MLRSTKLRHENSVGKCSKFGVSLWVDGYSNTKDMWYLRSWRCRLIVTNHFHKLNSTTLSAKVADVQNTIS